MTMRKPYSDATALLGKILNGLDARRDAVHLACEPITNTTSTAWYSGQMLARLPSGQFRAAREGDTVIGIVDPFLAAMSNDEYASVSPGDQCFIILLPGAITSLRHVWEHPDFDSAVVETSSEATNTSATESEEALEISEARKSEEWLRDYADEHGVDYHEMMAAAKGHILRPNDWSNYVTGGAEAEGAYTGEDFWNHIGKVLGITVMESQYGNIISCSC